MPSLSLSSCSFSSDMRDSRKSALRKLEELGPSFSTQVRKIRKALYELTLDHPSQFDGWLRKFYGLISDFSSVIGCEIEDEDKLLLLKLSLRPTFDYLRQHIQSHPKTTFQEALGMLRSSCIVLKRKAVQSNSLFISNNQKLCHECSSDKHLARNCPVRLTMERHFCSFCNRFVFHQTHEHKDFGMRKRFKSVASPRTGITASALSLRRHSRSHQNKQHMPPKIVLHLGSAHHVFSDKSLFVGGLSPIMHQVSFNGQNKSSSGMGSVIIRNVKIKSVHFVPDSHINALSVSDFIDHGCNVSFFRGGSAIKYQGHTLLSFSESSGEYILDQMPGEDFVYRNAKTVKFSDEVFHHPDSESVIKDTLMVDPSCQELGGSVIDSDHMHEKTDEDLTPRDEDDQMLPISELLLSQDTFQCTSSNLSSGKSSRSKSVTSGSNILRSENDRDSPSACSDEFIPDEVSVQRACSDEFIPDEVSVQPDSMEAQSGSEDVNMSVTPRRSSRTVTQPDRLTYDVLGEPKVGQVPTVNAAVGNHDISEHNSDNISVEPAIDYSDPSQWEDVLFDGVSSGYMEHKKTGTVVNFTLFPIS